jgi:soluble lytic murein transglycosylase
VRAFQLIFVILSLGFNSENFANPAYLNKFKTYQFWYTHLPLQEQAELEYFIHQPGPLAKQLREKWLLYLGQKQQWNLFLKHYQTTTSISLQCYAATAFWQHQMRDKASQLATPLWLQGVPQPDACNMIFHTLAQQPTWRQQYWAERIRKALDNHHLLLARQLLHRGDQIDKIAADQFWKVHTQPEYFKHIQNQRWRGEQTLYALKRMVDLHRKSVLADFQFAQNQHLINEDQKQRFLAHYSLYAFMRQQADANFWMQQVQKKYHHPTLLEWQMRFGILHQNWRQVEMAIQNMQKPFIPEQEYWLAQAQKHLKLQESAHEHLRNLARQRNYYGFLASRELNRAPSFQEQGSCQASLLPYEYQGLLAEIQHLHQTKTLGRAAQILNDFILELPMTEKCALVDWVMNHLNWPTEAIALSNKPELINQVALRFPTKYADFVKHRAKQLHLEPAFVYAIIRQESAFHPQVVSPVGARGLMQMMPNTAKIISKNYRIPYRVDAELFTPYKNIEIGTQYLAHLHKIFKHHPLLVAAAYNAGPGAVNKWLKELPSTNIIAWIDTLPWRETRNYIKNIIAFQVIYQHRLGYQTSMENMLSNLPYQYTKKPQQNLGGLSKP